MITDSKIFKQNTSKLTPNDKGQYIMTNEIYDKQGAIIHKSIIVIHHINKLKIKNHMIIPIITEKLLQNSNIHLIIANFRRKVSIKEIHHTILKATCEN